MTDEPKQCPKCPGKMEQGFLPDYSHSTILVMTWYPGIPKKSFWRGLKLNVKAGLPIGAFRCKLCGFLELYANEDYAAEK